jgi:hypothetical protein
MTDRPLDEAAARSIVLKFGSLPAPRPTWRRPTNASPPPDLDIGIPVEPEAAGAPVSQLAAC